jgi:hypothetical protein
MRARNMPMPAQLGDGDSFDLLYILQVVFYLRSLISSRFYRFIDFLILIFSLCRAPGTDCFGVVRAGAKLISISPGNGGRSPDGSAST